MANDLDEDKKELYGTFLNILVENNHPNTTGLFVKNALGEYRICVSEVKRLRKKNPLKNIDYEQNLKVAIANLLRAKKSSSEIERIENLGSAFGAYLGFIRNLSDETFSIDDPSTRIYPEKLLELNKIFVYNLKEMGLYIRLDYIKKKLQKIAKRIVSDQTRILIAELASDFA